MKLKLNQDLNGHKKGDVVRVKEKNGVPADVYWRRRLKDAAIDNCIEVVAEKQYKVKEYKQKKGEVEDGNDS